MEDIFDNKRHDKESTEDYKIRRKENQINLKKLNTGSIYWPSTLVGAFNQERADALAQEYIKEDGEVVDINDLKLEEPKFRTEEEEALYQKITQGEGVKAFHKSMIDFANRLKQEPEDKCINYE